eukprot:TRINITY_DN131_c0_g1_i1.p1 TRINITY_DN131_c0_g1~~TRINITY_DN131_c0_g1_i1.p1  ORF type:complete len:498 (+),score=120.66 TRINITY_DN131_c0_g1_i1:41-1534(+)
MPSLKLIASVLALGASLTAGMPHDLRQAPHNLAQQAHKAMAHLRHLRMTGDAKGFHNHPLVQQRVGSIGVNGSEPGDGKLAPPPAGTLTPLPQVADQFTADVSQQNTMFPFGAIKGKYYYDYPSQVDRLDATVFGVTQIMLNVYGTRDAYTITGAPGSWQCEWANLTNDQFSTQIPPIANFLGTQAINGGVSSQVWDFDFFGLAYSRSWNTVPGSDPKVLSTPVRTYSKINAAGFIVEDLIDFSNVQVGAPASNLFDPKQFGCAPPVPPPTFRVAGYIIDAVTGRPIPNVPLQISGTAVNGRKWTETITATPQGTYSAGNIPQGTIVLSASVSGYLAATTQSISVTGNIAAGTVADLALSPTLPAKAFRVVLKWGSSPRDLDTHLMTTGGVDVCYNRKASNGASLDIDRTNGFGPETVTVADQSAGASGTLWKYYVFNYSGGDIRQSNAVVYLYTATGLAQSIPVPTNQDTQRWWHVLDVDTSGQVTIVNKLVPSKN